MNIQVNDFLKTIQHNCNISDARDHGIYSMCTMVLKLRNLYKWEHHLEPWEEPEPANLLDWIDGKENYWETIADQSFTDLLIDRNRYNPADLKGINEAFDERGLIYGFGYGRSMKAVFFLAEKEEERFIDGVRVIIMGRELAKEMASPFAMAQDGVVYVRRESLRYFLWDQIQELRSTCRLSFRHALELYGVLGDQGNLDQRLLKEKFNALVEQELDLFIYHEIGELLQSTLDSATLQKIIGRFPGSVIELVCRSLKDILADTHPEGLLARLIQQQRETSLSFYVGFLDGLRKTLFPEIFVAFGTFLENRDWRGIEQARQSCCERNLQLARTVRNIAAEIGKAPDELVQHDFYARVVEPLGLEIPG